MIAPNDQDDAGGGLALIDAARAALSKARTLEDVKAVRDQAATVAYYAARRSGAEEAEKYANEIRLRAERRIGELTAAMEKVQGKPVASRPEGAKSKTTALAAVGIASEDASRFERMASIPAKRFEAEVVKPEATTRGLASIGGEYRPKRERQTAARVAQPGVPMAMLKKRAATFQVELDRLVRKYVQKWPAGAPMAPLADVLVFTAKSLGEE